MITKAITNVGPSTLKRNTSMQVRTIYVLLLTMLLLYGFGIIVISAPIIGGEVIVNHLIGKQEYVLLVIILCLVLLHRPLILINIIPVMFVIAYFLFALFINDEYKVQHLRSLYYLRNIIFLYMHYIIFTNILRKLDNKVIFLTFIVLGLFTSIFYIYTAFQYQWVIGTIIDYGRRITSEELGMQINQNTVSLLFVGISALLVVMKQNLLITKKMRFSLYVYHSIAFFVVITNGTISAFVFFLVVTGYDLYKMSPTWRPCRFIVVILICVGVFSMSTDYYHNKINLTMFDRLVRGGSIEYRISSMNQSISAFVANPIFGIGRSRLVNLGMLASNHVDHNFFTLLLGSKGIIGLCAYVYFLYLLLGSHGKTFPGIYLLRAYPIYILLGTPGNCLIAYMAAFIYEFSRSKARFNKS